MIRFPFLMKSRRHFRWLRDFIPVSLVFAVAVSGIISFSAIAQESDGATLQIKAAEEGGLGRGQVVVQGLPGSLLKLLVNKDFAMSAWQEFFAIYTGEKIPVSTKKLPIIGDYAIDGEVVRFIPRFPFVKGTPYSARFDPAALPDAVSSVWTRGLLIAVEATFLFPKLPEESSTVVSQIFPSRNDLPENLLKFYIYFSAPMSRGEAYSHIHLLAADGAAVEAPFLDLKPELWDPDSRRLTLFFDPGRIKRGLRPHEDLGMALREGDSYELRIDRDLRDAGGNRLKDSFTKRFTVTPADRTSPDYRQWRLNAPFAGDRQMLSLELDEPLDHALLGRMIRVENNAGQAVAGVIKISASETEWHFLPDQPWNKGQYSIHVEPDIEDLAGNKPFKLFDVDLTKIVSNPRDEKVSLAFKVE